MAHTRICPNCFRENFRKSCSYCGYIALAHTPGQPILPSGTLLRNRYLLGRALGAGGFGVTYLAKDTNSSILYAIKEYFPLTMAVRNTATLQVSPSCSDNREIFENGLQVFRKETQVLRHFAGNPSIVQVFDTFEENGTAYFVMEYLDGVNLKVLMRSMGGRIPVAMSMQMLDSMVSILSRVHGQGMLHRDVSPENIFITKSGQIKLIDFGATRFFVGERSQSLSVILKPGFAPPEQYSSKGKQGPWTDIYALCATFFCVLWGQTLPDAPSRLAGADIPSLAYIAPELGQQRIQAVEQGLALSYKMRQKSMEELYAQLHVGGCSSFIPSGRPVAVSAPVTGTPFVQRLCPGKSNDKWLIPKNITISIGRSAELNNIIIDEANVSRVHCEIIYNDKTATFYITDRSSNGTIIGDERTQKGRAYPLEAGDMFYMTTRENAMKVGLE